jgi:hypothetical protein
VRKKPLGEHKFTVRSYRPVIARRLYVVTAALRSSGKKKGEMVAARHEEMSKGKVY